MNKPENPPAFPGLIGTSGYGCAKLVTTPGGQAVVEEYSQGMTLRDYFAAKIAAGDAAQGEGWIPTVNDQIIASRVAFYYKIADAMLAARAKTT